MTSPIATDGSKHLPCPQLHNFKVPSLKIWIGPHHEIKERVVGKILLAHANDVHAFIDNGRVCDGSFVSYQGPRAWPILGWPDLESHVVATTQDDHTRREKTDTVDISNMARKLTLIK